MSLYRYDTDTYFEIAVGSYRGKCNKALYADRALLLQLDHLMARGQYKEAVQVCVKSTGEDSDLRSGLLLEQAAHCFLNCTPAMYRKFAFHLILAGHRFGKSGHRSHALRCYFQALRVLQGKRWSLAEDHIHFTVGRQSFYVNDFPHALEAFSQLLREDKEGSPQEASYLREYLFTLNRYLLDERDSLAQQANPLPTGETPSHDQAHAGKTDLRPLLPVPTIKNERLFVILQRHAPLSTAAHSMPSTPVNGTLLGTTGDRGPMTSPSVATRTATGAVHATAVAEPLEDIRMWAAMEQTVSERYVTDSDKRRWDFPVFRPSVPVLTSHTDNTRHPIVAPYEDVCVEFAITNTLRVPLVLKDVRLSCVWTPIQDTTHPPSTGETNHQLSTGEIDQRPSTGEAEAEVEGEGYHTTPLANVHLECGETQTLLLVVTPLRMVCGWVWGLCIW
ncbi:hypothetical protein SARC_08953 [Sphaeroforma arctica JP610]|uniref:TPPC8 first Ig-like domain-containing protein n=1 Tax=Sphaeroforma arctica JP610 TaxID=667725 RepID=A0A0L0FRN4_9EUKA|nr:hypothetical protein SARC_08953 [Sphaeroforma arctica JP610]KNC78623.1 hypothetical protein SARC_08953 [Sphaeroforma arctica JP610]|eukprot:XP_014152525.1 hypothetical protein SARC_08953 [Sphaeroforma arctica JP610]